MGAFGPLELQVELVELVVLLPWRDVDNPEASEAEGWWLGVAGSELSCKVLENWFLGHRFSKEGVILLNIHS